MFACVRLLLLSNLKRSLRVEQRDTEAPTAEPPVVTLPQALRVSSLSEGA
jgi:hypothetical protein